MPCHLTREGNDIDQEGTTTYRELQDLVCQIANWLKSVGVKQGDDVTIYMPMIPELPATMASVPSHNQGRLYQPPLPSPPSSDPITFTSCPCSWPVHVSGPFIVSFLRGSVLSHSAPASLIAVQGSS